MNIPLMLAERGVDVSRLEGPVNLAATGLALPRSPGVYLITCGDCLAHIGTSDQVLRRVRQLARLQRHYRGAEVLCASFCTGEPPLVWWEPFPDHRRAREREGELKRQCGEPPIPRDRFETCINGARLKAALLRVAGESSWEAGYIEAVFTLSGNLHLLLSPRFAGLWDQVGLPPGPWSLRRPPDSLDERLE